MPHIELSGFGHSTRLASLLHPPAGFSLQGTFQRGEKTPYFAMWVADTTFMYPQEPVEEPAAQ
jgi:hypothetical protein